MKSTLYILFHLLIITSITSSCGNGDQDNKVNQIDNSISATIAMPVDINHVIDTANLAKITLDQTTLSFDTIPAGTIVTKTFGFTNTGRRPLNIYDVTTSCGCTAIDIPEKIIKPGENGEIRVQFDSSDRRGYQNKTINIIGNTIPNRTLLYLQGFVN